VSKGVIIVPFRIEDVLPTKSLEYFIGAVHWLDALTPPFEHHLKLLAATIQSILGYERPRDAGLVAREGHESVPVMAAKQDVESHETLTPAHDGVGNAKTDGKSIGSLICGLLSLFFPAALAAIILGHLSRRDIRKSGGKLKGEKMALAGLMLGYAGIIALPILILAAIAIPNLMRSRIAANESSAELSLRTIYTAVIGYETSNGKLPADLRSLGPQAPGSSQNEGAANLIDAELAQGMKSGYKFTYQLNPDSSNFKIEAAPLVPGKTGLRYMWMDKSGEVQSFYNPPGP